MESSVTATQALQATVDAQTVLVYDLRVQEQRLKQDIVQMSAQKDDLETSIKKYEEGVTSLKNQHTAAAANLEKVKEESKGIKQDAEEFAKTEREKIFKERNELEKEKDEIAKKRAAANDEEHTLNQRSLKLDSVEEALDKKASNIVIQEQSIKAEKDILQARKDQIAKEERVVRDKMINLDSTEASFKKQEVILGEMEEKAKASFAEARAEKEAAANLLIKVQKEQAKIDNKIEKSRTFYDMAKGVRNQIISATGKEEKESVTTLLDRAFAAMGLDVPADSPSNNVTR